MYGSNSFSEFSCSGMCAHLFDRIRDVSNHNFKIIGNLKPYTMYSFAVQGYSGNGAGLLSEEVIVRTLEAGKPLLYQFILKVRL